VKKYFISGTILERKTKEGKSPVSENKISL